MECHLTGLKWLQSVLGLLLLWPLAAFAEPPVVVSIKPLHSLVAAVMQGVGEPTLLVQGGASPHDYSLRPSEVRAINNAAVVFWIGPELEGFLGKPLDNVKAKVKAVALATAPGVERLSLRAGGAWQAADAHAHDSHGQGAGYDPHSWLDPVNAIAMVRQIVAVLAEIDATHRTDYRQNGERLIGRLEQLNQQLTQTLIPIKDQAYVVFHDAYQYFERRYGLHSVGSVVLNPEQRPGAKRVSEIQARIRDLKVRCVFSEPQFQPTLVEIVIAGSGARRGVLDPLGAEFPAGSEAYFMLLRRLAADLTGCLGGA